MLILKIREKILLPLLLFYIVQGEDAHRQIEPELKVEIEDGREAPEKPSFINLSRLGKQLLLLEHLRFFSRLR